MIYTRTARLLCKKAGRQTPKLKRSVFSGKITFSYDSVRNQDKDDFNAKVCEVMVEQSVKTVLLMDSKLLRSSKACLDIGLKKENITTVEIDRHVHNSHLRQGFHSFHANVWDVLSLKNSYVPYGALNLDTICSAKTVTKNIENAFKNKYLQKSSVLAITVAKRCRKGEHFVTKFDELKRKIARCATKYGYTSELKDEHHQTKVVSLIYALGPID